MSDCNREFQQKLGLLLIDKVGIGVILLCGAFFLNHILNRYQIRQEYFLDQNSGVANEFLVASASFRAQMNNYQTDLGNYLEAEPKPNMEAIGDAVRAEGWKTAGIFQYFDPDRKISGEFAEAITKLEKDMNEFATSVSAEVESGEELRALIEDHEAIYSSSQKILESSLQKGVLKAIKHDLRDLQKIEFQDVIIVIVFGVSAIAVFLVGLRLGAAGGCLPARSGAKEDKTVLPILPETSDGSLINVKPDDGDGSA